MSIAYRRSARNHSVARCFDPTSTLCSRDPHSALFGPKRSLVLWFVLKSPTTTLLPFHHRRHPERLTWLPLRCHLHRLAVPSITSTAPLFHLSQRYSARYVFPPTRLLPSRPLTTVIPPCRAKATNTISAPFGSQRRARPQLPNRFQRRSLRNSLSNTHNVSGLKKYATQPVEKLLGGGPCSGRGSR